MVTNVVIGVAVVALLIYRQLRTRPVNASGLRLAAFLGVIGLVETYEFVAEAPRWCGHLRRPAGQPRARRRIRRAAGRDGPDLAAGRPAMVARQLGDRITVGRRR